MVFNFYLLILHYMFKYLIVDIVHRPVIQNLDGLKSAGIFKAINRSWFYPTSWRFIFCMILEKDHDFIYLPVNGSFLTGSYIKITHLQKCIVSDVNYDDKRVILLNKYLKITYSFFLEYLFSISTLLVAPSILSFGNYINSGLTKPWLLNHVVNHG